MSMRTLRVGTRGSDLALAQTTRVTAGIEGPSETVLIKTSGDVFQDRPLHQTTDIGFFTKEIERGLIEGEIDLAVHSLKDLPTSLAPGLVLGALLSRDAAGDVLLVRKDAMDEGREVPLADGARIGAASMRRSALISRFAPWAIPSPIRGNVPTRIEKLARGDYDAVVLARAGLERLRLDVAPLLAFDLNPSVWVCAPGQGAIAVECRGDDREALGRIAVLDDGGSRARVCLERRILELYGGGCHAALGAHCEHSVGGYRLAIGAGAKDGFVLTELLAPWIEGLEDAAAAWLSDPVDTITERGQWICRRAEPWC